MKYCRLLLLLTLFLWAPVSGGCIIPWCPVQCLFCIWCWTNKLIDWLIDVLLSKSRRYFTCSVGHGLSEGERMYITDFDNYCKDVVQHINVVKNKHKKLPFFIVAHSMVSTSQRRCRGITIGVGWNRWSTAYCPDPVGFPCVHWEFHSQCTLSLWIKQNLYCDILPLVLCLFYCRGVKLSRFSAVGMQKRKLWSCLATLGFGLDLDLTHLVLFTSLKKIHWNMLCASTAEVF